jgi:hypothetical protein
MSHLAKILALSILVLAAAPAVAADLTQASLGEVKKPDTPWSVGLEVSPEFYAVTKGSNQAGDYADTAIKGSLGYTYDKVWVLNGSFQATLKNNGTEQYYAEGGVGYKFKFGDFSLTPSAALGETWDQTGLGDDGDSSALYYALYLAGDLKLNSQWSWTVFNLRWRNAFDYTWETPKASTGLTYSFSDTDKFSLGLGYSWKDTGSGMNGDKINVAFSMKHAF